MSFAVQMGFFGSSWGSAATLRKMTRGQAAILSAAATTAFHMGLSESNAWTPCSYTYHPASAAPPGFWLLGLSASGLPIAPSRNGRSASLGAPSFPSQGEEEEPARYHAC
ncbi:hypothetical protein MAP00_002271 [Monascus purpureus]|nr:hypothetical protein MAP00_002271 [Monascus purpureus]